MQLKLLYIAKVFYHFNFCYITQTVVQTGMAPLQFGKRAVDLAWKKETRNLLRTWKPPSQVRAGGGSPSITP